MILSDILKDALNYLQTRLVPCTASDNILLIFDNKECLIRYKKKHELLAPNIICITLSELCNEPSKTIGLRYKRYAFMKEDMI